MDKLTGLFVVGAIVALAILARWFDVTPLPGDLTPGWRIVSGFGIELVALIIWLRFVDLIPMRSVAIIVALVGAISFDVGMTSLGAPFVARAAWALVPICVGMILFGALEAPSSASKRTVV